MSQDGLPEHNWVDIPNQCGQAKLVINYEESLRGLLTQRHAFLTNPTLNLQHRIC